MNDMEKSHWLMKTPNWFGSKRQRWWWN
jgi:hypothetical protein